MQTGSVATCGDRLVMSAMDVNWNGGVHAILDRLSQIALC